MLLTSQMWPSNILRPKLRVSSQGTADLIIMNAPSPSSSMSSIYLSGLQIMNANSVSLLTITLMLYSTFYILKFIVKIYVFVEHQLHDGNLTFDEI